MLWMSADGKAIHIASLINTFPLWWRMAWFISLKLGSLSVQHDTHEDLALDAKFLTTTRLRQSFSPSLCPGCKHVFNLVICPTCSSHDNVCLVSSSVLTGSNFVVYCVTLNVRAVPSHNTGLWFLWTKGTSMWQDCRGHCWINCLLTASRVIHQQLATDTPEI